MKLTGKKKYEVYYIVQDFNWEMRFGLFENQTIKINNRDRYFTSQNIEHVQEDQFGYENKNGERVKKLINVDKKKIYILK